jgi:prevent-host-death family protein
MADIWQLQDAKSRFSELVEQALLNGAQIVTRRGRKTVVVLPYEQYQRLTERTGSLSQFLLSSPFAGSELVIGRDPDAPRDIGIEP